MTVEVLRGTQRITMRIPVVAERHDVDRLLDLADPDKNLVPGLGVIAINLNETIAKMLGDLRINSGVVVVAKTTFGGGLGTALQPGDIIHAVNNQQVSTLDQLREKISSVKSGQAVVLQFERDGVLDFVSFEAE
jgi:serine protease Do